MGKGFIGVDEMKVTTCTIVKNEEFFIDMYIKSCLQFADEVVIVDDYSTDRTKEIVEKYCKKDKRIKFCQYHFSEHFGKGRAYAFSKATGDWIFWLDADEVIHELNAPHIKPILKDCEKKNIDAIHVEYVHFIENFGKIDNSQAMHIGITRLHKNYKNKITWPRKNHSLPSYKWKKQSLVPQIIIWHLGYLCGMRKIQERFKRNFLQSEIHSPYQQVKWRDWHYFGDYPTRPIVKDCIPQLIKDKYLMEGLKK